DPQNQENQGMVVEREYQVLDIEPPRPSKQQLQQQREQRQQDEDRLREIAQPSFEERLLDLPRLHLLHALDPAQRRRLHPIGEVSALLQLRALLRELLDIA